MPGLGCRSPLMRQTRVYPTQLGARFAGCRLACANRDSTIDAVSERCSAACVKQFHRAPLSRGRTRAGGTWKTESGLRGSLIRNPVLHLLRQADGFEEADHHVGDVEFPPA